LRPTSSKRRSTGNCACQPPTSQESRTIADPRKVAGDVGPTVRLPPTRVHINLPLPREVDVPPPAPEEVLVPSQQLPSKDEAEPREEPGTIRLAADAGARVAPQQSPILQVGDASMTNSEQSSNPIRIAPNALNRGGSGAKPPPDNAPPAAHHRTMAPTKVTD
jgi:hypothetical protein